jgi:vacuolar-type H+-ATPase subunit D/Vma8
LKKISISFLQVLRSSGTKQQDAARDKILLELQQEAYRRKVDQANHCRTQLRQAFVDAEAEIAICSAMGSRQAGLSLLHNVEEACAVSLTLYTINLGVKLSCIQVRVGRLVLFEHFVFK